MSDYNSSLPIRTENAGDAIVKVADATIPSQQLAVNADGSINVGDNGASLTVDATDLDIRDLDSAQDSVEVLQATHDNLNANANIQVADTDVSNANPVPVSDAGGSLTVDATDLDIRDLDSAQDSVEVLQATHDNLNANANIQVGDADVGNANPVPVSDAGGSVTVDATDLDIRNLSAAQDNVAIRDAGGDELAINTDGSINVVLSNDVPGTEICDRKTTASVVANASTNHDYTVTAGKTLTLEGAQAAGSGKIKVQILVNGVIKFDDFNSTANPSIKVPMYRMVKATAGQVVRVTITNLDNQPQDLYSTIMGSETP
jgi:hypothetical protein